MKRKNEDISRSNLFVLILKTIWHGLSWTLQGIWTLIAWLLKQPFRLLYYLFNGRVPKFENSRQEEAFWRVKRRYRRRFFLSTHRMIFVLVCLLGIVSAGIQHNYIFRLPSPDLTGEWRNQHLLYLRDDILTGSLMLAVWFVVLCIHAVLVRTAQNEDTELERVMEREYERIEQEHIMQRDYSRLVEQYNEADFEVDNTKAKRNHHTNHHSDNQG